MDGVQGKIALARQPDGSFALPPLGLNVPTTDILNLLLGNTDNHAKNHALLYLGTRPDLAPIYDVAPVLVDDQVLHQLSFNIGDAIMTDEVTSKEMHALSLPWGFRVSPER